MKQYLELLKRILENGEPREDRTGTGTLSIFGHQTRYNLKEGFPLLTTKKMSFKSIYAELLWFLEGSNDERRLAEILYGTRDSCKKTIWTANCQDPTWLEKANFEGDCGKIYGVQWRRWNNGSITIDQIKNVIESIKTNPNSRRHIVTAWNPSDISQMVLPPCHMIFQFYVSNDKKLSCHMLMRSNDVPLGLPYNIASYATLVHLIAQCCGLEVGELIISISETHIYLNQIEGIKLQLTRTPTKLPTLIIDKSIKNIDDFKIDSLKVIDYFPQEAIIFPFSV